MHELNILMVEDNRGDVVLIKEAICAAGLDYHVTVVRDGVAALEYLRGHGAQVEAPRPQLILLDLKLPRKSGREVLAELAADPGLCHIPVAILSSSRSELELARIGRPPNQADFTKPNTFAGYVELLKTIEAFRQGAGREAREKPA